MLNALVIDMPLLPALSYPSIPPSMRNFLSSFIVDFSNVFDSCLLTVVLIAILVQVSDSHGLELVVILLFCHLNIVLAISQFMIKNILHPLVMDHSVERNIRSFQILALNHSPVTQTINIYPPLSFVQSVKILLFDESQT